MPRRLKSATTWRGRGFRRFRNAPRRTANREILRTLRLLIPLILALAVGVYLGWLSFEHEETLDKQESPAPHR